MSPRAVACFVLDEAGRLLTVRRARDPEKGTLDLPGGFVDPGGGRWMMPVRRELREETGLEATEVRLLFSIPNVYPYSGGRCLYGGSLLPDTCEELRRGDGYG